MVHKAQTDCAVFDQRERNQILRIKRRGRRGGERSADKRTRSLGCCVKLKTSLVRTGATCCQSTCPIESNCAPDDASKIVASCVWQWCEAGCGSGSDCDSEWWQWLVGGACFGVNDWSTNILLVERFERLYCSYTGSSRTAFQC